MSCSPQFPAEVKFACILELINDVRSGLQKPIVITTKASWHLGCILTTFGGAAVPEVGVQSEKTTLDLCDQIEVGLHGFGSEASVTAASVPPWLQDLILQLLLRLINGAFNG